MMLVNVCACFDVMISDHKSRVACKAAPAAVLSFFRYSAFFFLFLFSFLQCFWPCPFFFLHGPMLIWKSYNLNRFAKPTRCHPFNSFLQQPGVITCMVVILFATRGSIPLKNDHDEEFKSQVFYWSCYVYCCERYDNQREESFKRWGKRRIHGIFFVIEPIAALSACSFLPGAVNLAKPSLVKYLFLLSAMSRKSHCSNDTQFQPAC